LKAWNDPARTKTPDLPQCLDKPAPEILGNYSHGDVKVVLKKYRPTTNIGPNLSQLSVNYPSDAESDDVMEMWDMRDEEKANCDDPIQVKDDNDNDDDQSSGVDIQFPTVEEARVGKRQMLFRWLVLS
jgi:hypothetical protein